MKISIIYNEEDRSAYALLLSALCRTTTCEVKSKKVQGSCSQTSFILEWQFPNPDLSLAVWDRYHYFAVAVVLLHIAVCVSNLVQ